MMDDGWSHISLDCSGGLELLFNKIKDYHLVFNNNNNNNKSNSSKENESKVLSPQPSAAATTATTETTEESNVNTLKDLLIYIRQHLLCERPELFMQDDSV